MKGLVGNNSNRPGCKNFHQTGRVAPLNCDGYPWPQERFRAFPMVRPDFYIFVLHNVLDNGTKARRHGQNQTSISIHYNQCNGWTYSIDT